MRIKLVDEEDRQLFSDGKGGTLSDSEIADILYHNPAPYYKFHKIEEKRESPPSKLDEPWREKLRNARGAIIVHRLGEEAHLVNSKTGEVYATYGKEFFEEHPELVELKYATIK